MSSSSGPSIKPSDRVLLVGKTGSGKTTLARALLQPYRQVIVHDAKGTIDWDDYLLCRGLRDLDVNRRYASRLIYRPTAGEARDQGAQEQFFRWIFTRRNTLLYVDEVYLLCIRLSRTPDSYLACLQQGRERGVGVWSSTQRPTNIPLVVISEAEHCYCFSLRLWRDRKRIEDEWGVPRDAQMDLLGTHDYIYANEEGVRGRTRLTLA